MKNLEKTGTYIGPANNKMIEKNEYKPLADRLRPVNMDEIVGQQHLVGIGKVLRKAVENDCLQSFILWGPPGTGKTTIAQVAANLSKCNFVEFSAVTSGIKEVKEVMKSAEDQLSLFRRKTVLFVDEIHRFNKSQQDAFLPYIEKGTIIFIGATTENPSFELNSALLSRCQIYTLNPLSEEEIRTILHNAISNSERGLADLQVVLSSEAEDYISTLCGGDARSALNTLELAANLAATTTIHSGPYLITREHAEQALQRKTTNYDKSGEEHYNIISALHKSMRGSDPDAALYWFARMIQGGEDPLYIGRRLVRFASEDIGNAAPNALAVTIAACEAYERLGHPEGELALAQAVIYLACSPKSNAIYKAYNDVMDFIKNTRDFPVPKHIRNAPTQLMKNLDYGTGYKYAHDYPDHYVYQEYLPEDIKEMKWYNPDGQGYEKEIMKRLEFWKSKQTEDSKS